MRIMKLSQMLLLILFSTLPAIAQSGDGEWRKTIIVTTLDGTTMEYFIDTDTKIKIEKPNLVIETEGVVINYELEKMAKVRYGKKSNSTGLNNITNDDQPFKWENETIFFDHLSVLFTLDEKEVKHELMPRQVKKAQVMGALTALMGIVAGKPGVVGTGMLAASRSSSTSTLANVARLIPCRRMNLIKVNQLLNKNRIFVPDEDFDFVYDFLCQHSPKAKY